MKKFFRLKEFAISSRYLRHIPHTSLLEEQLSIDLERWDQFEKWASQDWPRSATFHWRVARCNSSWHQLTNGDQMRVSVGVSVFFMCVSKTN